MREEESTTAAGDLRTSAELHLKVGRDTASIDVSILTEFVETPAGAPVSMRSEQRLGALPIVTECRWIGDPPTSVEIVEQQAERETRRTVPWPPKESGAKDGAAGAPALPILTPAAAGRFTEERIRAGATEITLRTIDPTNGVAPLTATRRLKPDAPDQVEAFGKVVPAKAWVVTQSVAPGVETIEWLSDNGDLVRGDTNIGGLTLTMLATEKEIALLPSSAGPPELMAMTFITPSKPIERPREAKKAVYIVRVKDGELPDLPTTASQKFERIDARSGRVTVADGAGGADAEADEAGFLASSVMIASDDFEVRRLAASNCGAAARGDGAREADQASRLGAMRAAVRDHITSKNLGVGFATAAEVARTRTGDCTEHAVLLAAALRACDVPSRCATGVVYVDDFAGQQGVFGFHMWSQALTRGAGDAPRWRDLDATLPGDRAFDAAHITLSVSAMADDDRVNALAAVAPLIGRLQIDVESIEY